MSTNWGLALDAELAYRHDRIRSDFRPWRRNARRAGADARVTGLRKTTAAVGLPTSLRAVESTARVVGASTRDRQQATEGQQVRAA
jgi:hypothetical protein